MTKLYKIGTQLIMHRPSQMLLAQELGFKVIGRYWSQYKNDYEESELDFEGEYPAPDDGAYITVTEQNQKWLSPVPIVDDLCEFLDREYYLFDGYLFGNCIISIKLRTYPNGQCAPLIEFDEVIEP